MSKDKEMTSVNELSISAGIAFGTSGLRGLVANLTPTICYSYTAAFIHSICSINRSPDAPQSIAIAMDLRPSSPAIVKACVQAIEDAGYSAVFCGAIPTPALAFYAMTHDMACIMVTGSHIPFDRNGIKFYRATGEISKTDEQTILASNVGIPPDLDQTVAKKILPTLNQDASALFLSRYTSLFSNTVPVLSGQRVGFYQHSSVARDLLTHALESLGAEVVALERTETFVPIDTEAVSTEDKDKGRQWAKKGFDALLSTDGDGDRPLIGDENGNWLRGDIVGVLCAEYLGATHAVTPVNSNTSLDSSAVASLRTRIGSPYVIEGMNTLLKQNSESTHVVGYEANGGFLVGSDLELNGQKLAALPTRDSFLPIVLLLVNAKQKQKKLSELAGHLTPRFTASDRIKNVPSEKSQALLLSLSESIEKQEKLFQKIAINGERLKLTNLNQLDGLRMHLSNEEIVHLRPSGNAPELRCYAEADSNERAEEIVELVLKSIAN